MTGLIEPTTAEEDADAAEAARKKAPPTPEEQRSALVRLITVLAAAALATVITGTTKTVAVVVALITMIMLHELGHYLTAKWGGMKVTEFFVGFGPRLWSVRKGETEYGVKALPLGGYVKIIGMHNLDPIEDPADEPRTYRQQPFGRRPLGRRGRLDDALPHRLPAVLHRQRRRGRPHRQHDRRQRPRLRQRRPEPGPGGRPEGRRQDRVRRRPGHRLVGGRAVPHRRQPGRAPQPEGRAQGPAAGPDGHARRHQPGPDRRRGHLQRQAGLPRPRAGGEGEDRRPDHRDRSFGQAVGGRRLPGRRGRVARAHRQRQGAGQHRQPVRRLQPLDEHHRRQGRQGRPRRCPVPVARRLRAGRRAGRRQQPLRRPRLLIAINLFVGIFNLLPLLPLDGGHVAIAVYEAVRSKIAKRKYTADVAKLMPLTYAVVLLMIFGVSALYLDIVRPLNFR